MAPIRRYLRITQWSVLEVRIYLDNPALAHTWLLNPRDPALPRVIQAVRPLVLPKLREERERAKGKGKRAKGIKDTVSEGDFEVSIFLTEQSSPHSLLTKQKDFRGQRVTMKSNSRKLTGWLTGTHDKPVEVNEEDTPVVIREESDDEMGARLEDYPESNVPARRPKRAREEESGGEMMVDEVSDDEGFNTEQTSPSIRAMAGAGEGTADGDEGEDRKKPRLNTSYDGFSIYGRILCLVVKRRGPTGKAANEGGGGEGSGSTTGGGGQRMLESWVSTQAAQEQSILDDG